ncbi:hypothetical protein M404DRAFT_996927 [Pisolithus tinctorius Marx 270]|uniref:Uncharacterized protein n=1 Tax=Pisolithus tinctorius Marx 270 TaxID=870435 RepID=A0A0C3JHX2_PISTI|nr:hypothetical protein M404DRAFT_996927 [Pisolithus tinctorius Marx 270]
MYLQKISFATAVTCFNSLDVTTISAGDMCIAIYGSYGHNARCMNAGEGTWETEKEGRECGKRGALSDPRWEQNPEAPDWVVLRGVENEECEERERSGVRRREWSSNAWNERGAGGTGMREKEPLTYATNRCTTCKILWDRRLAPR